VKVVMTLLAKNEADTLPAFLAYHLANGVDFIIATDNCSTDGTTEILKNYEREGKLHYEYEAEDHFAQGRWVTNMARLAATKYHADWVINSDADEFWWPEHHSSIKEYLATIPDETQIIEVRRDNFLPLTVDAQESIPFWETMVIRDNESTNPLGEPLQPKVCHRAHPQVFIAYGNHRATINDRSKATRQEGLLVFHFPMRGLQQFTRKIVTGAEAINRNNEVGLQTGHTRRQLFTRRTLRQLVDKIANRGKASNRNDKVNHQICHAWRELYKLHQEKGLYDYYDEHVLRDPALSDGCASGIYVRDTRLRNRLRELLSSPC